jgi:dynein intermediate chain
MITSLATKTLKSAGRAGLSKGFLRGSGGLILSSGVDWTVKMWAPAYTDKPLLSLMSHSYDYMSDVQWSPSHPTLMATASSNGSVGLWNFALSLEEPITGSDGIVVEPEGGSSGKGLNKLKWSSDGRRMLAASADRVHVLVLAEDVVRQKGDEDAKMMSHLTSRGLLDRE